MALVSLPSRADSDTRHPLLCALVAQMVGPHGSREDKLRFLFRSHDMDKTGVVTKPELARMMAVTMAALGQEVEATTLQRTVGRPLGEGGAGRTPASARARMRTRRARAGGGRQAGR